MIDLRTIDELTRKLSEALPPGINQMKDDVQGQFKSVLSSAFEQMNLVSREEFDAQKAVLARTREKLEALEARLEELLED